MKLYCNLNQEHFQIVSNFLTILQFSAEFSCWSFQTKTANILCEILYWKDKTNQKSFQLQSTFLTILKFSAKFYCTSFQTNFPKQFSINSSLYFLNSSNFLKKIPLSKFVNHFLQNSVVEVSKPKYFVWNSEIYIERQTRKFSNCSQLFWHCSNSVQNSYLHLSKANFQNISVLIQVWWRKFWSALRFSDYTAGQCKIHHLEFTNLYFSEFIQHSAEFPCWSFQTKTANILCEILYWKTRQTRKVSKCSQLFWIYPISVLNSILHLSKPNFQNISVLIQVWWRKFWTALRFSDYNAGQCKIHHLEFTILLIFLVQFWSQYRKRSQKKISVVLHFSEFT